MRITIVASLMFLGSNLLALTPSDTPLTVQNILVCFEHDDASVSDSATFIKNLSRKSTAQNPGSQGGLNLDAKLYSFYFKSLSSQTATTPQMATPVSPAPAGGQGRMTMAPPDQSQDGGGQDSGPGAGQGGAPTAANLPRSKIKYVELLGLTWARQSFGAATVPTASTASTKDADGRSPGHKRNLILPKEGEDPLEFAFKIIQRLQYFNIDLYKRVSKILTGPEGEANTGRIKFSERKYVSDPLVSIAPDDKLTDKIKDPLNCVVTSYSQQIEFAPDENDPDPLPQARVILDTRLLDDETIHSYQSKGLYYLDQLMYYVSRNLFKDQTSNYTFLIADLLDRDLKVSQLAHDFATYFPGLYVRKDPLFVAYKKFITDSQSPDCLGDRPPYSDDANRTNYLKWKKLFEESFLKNIMTAEFDYLTPSGRDKVISLMREAMDQYWNDYVLQADSSGYARGKTIDGYFKERVLLKFPTEITIPVSEL